MLTISIYWEELRKISNCSVEYIGYMNYGLGELLFLSPYRHKAFYITPDAYAIQILTCNLTLCKQQSKLVPVSQMQQWQGLLKGQRCLLKEGMTKFSSRHLEPCLERSSWRPMSAICQHPLVLWLGHFTYPLEDLLFVVIIHTATILPLDNSNGCITRYLPFTFFLLVKSVINIAIIDWQNLLFNI